MNKDKRVIYIASILGLILIINHVSGLKATYKFLLLVFASVILYQFNVYKISFNKPTIMEKSKSNDDDMLKDFGLNPKDFENPSKIIKESKQISGGVDEKVNKDSKINPFSMNGLC